MNTDLKMDFRTYPATFSPVTSINNMPIGLKQLVSLFYPTGYIGFYVVEDCKKGMCVIFPVLDCRNDLGNMLEYNKPIENVPISSYYDEMLRWISEKSNVSVEDLKSYIVM